MAPVRLLSFVLDGPLLFQFSPVLVSSVRREVLKAGIHAMPVMLRAGTVQHSPPVKLLLDPVELAVMQQYSSVRDELRQLFNSYLFWAQRA